MKNDDKKNIAKEIGPYTYLFIENWVHLMSVVRNICAHHGRLFNRITPVTPKLSTEISKYILRGQEKKLFTVLLIIKTFNIDKEQWVRFIVDLNRIINKHKFKDLYSMGFPKNWTSILLDDNKLRVLEVKLKSIF